MRCSFPLPPRSVGGGWGGGRDSVYAPFSTVLNSVPRIASQIAAKG